MDSEWIEKGYMYIVRYWNVYYVVVSVWDVYVPVLPATDTVLMKHYPISALCDRRCYQLWSFYCIQIHRQLVISLLKLVSKMRIVYDSTIFHAYQYLIWSDILYTVCPNKSFLTIFKRKLPESRSRLMILIKFSLSVLFSRQPVWQDCCLADLRSGGNYICPFWKTYFEYEPFWREF